MTFKLNTMH